MCDLRKGFDLPRCICNKAPCSTFKGLLFNLHHHRAYSERHNVSCLPPRLAYISILRICFALPRLNSFQWKSKKWCLKRMRSVWRGLLFHLHQFKPVTPLIVTLSITLVPSSLPLGTCDCTWSVRTKLLWLRSSCYFPNLRQNERTKAHPPRPNCEQIALHYKLHTPYSQAKH